MSFTKTKQTLEGFRKAFEFFDESKQQRNHFVTIIKRKAPEKSDKH